MDEKIMKFKVVLLGDQSVGKTSILNRLIFDNFTGTEQPTVGVDFVSKIVHLKNKVLRMQFWDTAGQQRFNSLIPSYIKDCHAAIIVYDITNSNSYEHLTKWIDKVLEVRGDDSLIMVIGNKVDLQGQRKIQKTKAIEHLKSLNMGMSEVSAKTGQNVKQFFNDLSITLAFGKDNKQNSTPQAVTISLSAVNHKKEKKKAKCC